MHAPVVSPRCRARSFDSGVPRSRREAPPSSTDERSSLSVIGIGSREHASEYNPCGRADLSTDDPSIAPGSSSPTPGILTSFDTGFTKRVRRHSIGTSRHSPSADADVHRAIPPLLDERVARTISRRRCVSADPTFRRRFDIPPIAGADSCPTAPAGVRSSQPAPSIARLSAPSFAKSSQLAPQVCELACLSAPAGVRSSYESLVPLADAQSVTRLTTSVGDVDDIADIDIDQHCSPATDLRSASYAAVKRALRSAISRKCLACDTTDSLNCYPCALDTAPDSFPPRAHSNVLRVEGYRLSNSERSKVALDYFDSQSSDVCDVASTVSSSNVEDHFDYYRSTSVTSDGSQLFLAPIEQFAKSTSYKSKLRTPQKMTESYEYSASVKSLPFLLSCFATAFDPFANPRHPVLASSEPERPKHQSGGRDDRRHDLHATGPSLARQTRLKSVSSGYSPNGQNVPSSRSPSIIRQDLRERAAQLEARERRLREREHALKSEIERFQASNDRPAERFANRSNRRYSPSNAVVNAPAIRASSQIPPRSFVNQILQTHQSCRPSSSPNAPPSPPPSDSNADTDISEPSTVHAHDPPATRVRKKEARRRSKRARENRKRADANDEPVEPSIYEGQADFDIFQHWAFEVEEYFTSSHTRSSRKVRRLKHFLGGRAASIFMREVAVSSRKWKLGDFLQVLFDECFPSNFRTEQRVRLAASLQDGRTVREWTLDLEKLAASIGDVSERQLVLYFWAGSDVYIRAKWAEAGFNPEISLFADLALAAERYEEARKYRELEQLGDARPSSSNEDESDRESNVHGDSELDVLDDAPPSPARHPTTSSGNVSRDQQVPISSIAELRDLGLCFECQGPGHIARDCPQRQLSVARVSAPSPNSSVRSGEFLPRRYISHDDFLDLREEGRCFECFEVGHIGRDCPVRLGLASPYSRNDRSNASRSRSPSLIDAELQEDDYFLEEQSHEAPEADPFEDDYPEPTAIMSLGVFAASFSNIPPSRALHASEKRIPRRRPAPLALKSSCKLDDHRTYVVSSPSAPLYDSPCCVCSPRIRRFCAVEAHRRSRTALRSGDTPICTSSESPPPSPVFTFSSAAAPQANAN